MMKRSDDRLGELVAFMPLEVLEGSENLPSFFGMPTGSPLMVDFFITRLSSVLSPPNLRTGTPRIPNS